VLSASCFAPLETLLMHKLELPLPKKSYYILYSVKRIVAAFSPGNQNE